MKAFIRLSCVLLFSIQCAYSQLIFSMATDKPSYGYGEKIRVSGTVRNPTDSTIEIWGPYTGFFVPKSFNDVQFNQIFLPLDIQYRFPAKSSYRWEHEIDPLIFGLPNREGIQTLYGWHAPTWKLDSVTISAPAYYGGQLRVGLRKETSASSIQSLRDSMNATVLSSYEILDTIFEIWQISGFIIDSLVSKYRTDSRLSSITANRILHLAFRTMVNVHQSDNEVKHFSLSQNYPNPFNPATEIRFSLAEHSSVRLTIIDILGREVVTLIEGELPSGFHRARWNGTNDRGITLGSGIYFCRLSSQGRSGTSMARVVKMLMAK